MRIFEFLILLALAPLIIGRAFRPARRPDWLRALAWTALALALLHLVIEGYRWQMIPAYLLVVSGCLGGGKARGQASEDPGRRTTRSMARSFLGVAAWIGALILWIGALILGVGNPVFHYPRPTGPYAVGTTRLYFSDASRQDLLAPNPHAARELLVVAWYPADVAPGSQTEGFWPNASVSAPVLARIIHLPPFNFLGHLRLVRSHSYANAPAAPGRRPVLVFSHGYASTPWQNTVQMEELASHGFIVFSIGHTHESAAIAFPDGHTALMNPERMGTVTGDRPVLKGSLTESLGVWVADTRYVVGELAAMDGEAGSRFNGRLDLSRLGIFGMSFGGATAGEFCAHDQRCRAGMNMDGFQHGTLREHPLTVPFLYLAAGEGPHENDAIYAASQSDCYTVQVRHAAHANFSDMNLVAPILRYAGVLGSIDSQEMESILNAYTLAFFQQYLQGRQSPLLDGSSPTTRYPDVAFRACRNPAAR